VTLHAFVDESVRGRYMLCAVLVPSNCIDEIRKLARGLCLPGQRRWHFVDESKRRRRQILDTIARQEIVRTLMYTSRGSQSIARRECMTALIYDLVDRKASRLVMESIATQQADDRSCIAAALREAEAELQYMHMRPHEEPGLWLPDALTWAYGAGGDWCRRIRPAIEAVRDLRDVP
jgi:hypothetical protein